MRQDEDMYQMSRRKHNIIANWRGDRKFGKGSASLLREWGRSR